MKGEKRNTDPMERSISPATISITSPTARIANGAKYGSSVTKLPWVKNRSVFTEKYRIARRVTTMMLPSRSVRNRRARLSPPAPPPTARPPLPAGAVAGAWPEVLALLMASGLDHAGRGGGALVARLRAVVRLDRRL